MASMLEACLLAPYTATALLRVRTLSLGGGLQLFREGLVSLAFCKEQLMDGALFAEYESAVAVTATFARLASLSRATRLFAEAALPAERRELTANAFLRMCQQLQAAARSASPVSPAVQLQLMEKVGAGVVTSINRYVTEHSPTLYLTKKQLREHHFYQLHLACTEPIGKKQTGEGLYDMTTMSDVRVLALVYDALVEEELAGEYGLEAGNQGMAVGASMILVKPRTAAVRAAITDTGCCRADAGASPWLRTCALQSCTAREERPHHFKKCAECRFPVYCCKKHQVDHWPAHKAACKAVRKVKSAAGIR